MIQPPQPQSLSTGYRLDYLAVLCLAGSDALSFLQGYVTCNVEQLSSTEALTGAFCNIRGRVVADFLILRHAAARPPAYLLVVDASSLPTLLAAMEKYLMFSKSSLTDCSQSWQLLGSLNGIPATPSWPVPVATSRLEIHADSALYESAYCLDLSSRRLHILPAGSNPMAYGFTTVTEDANNWIYHEILATIPHICAATQEQFLPQALNLEKLGAVSFTKGCYLGQEIVARAQHRGKLKRTLARLNWQGPSLPLAGDIVQSANGDRLGKIISAATDPASSASPSKRQLHGKLLALLNKPLVNSAFVNDITISPE